MGELLDILACRVQAVEVVELGQHAEVVSGAAHLVANDDTVLARAVDLENIDDRAVKVLEVLHDLLVGFEGVLGGAFEEQLVEY